MADLPTSRPLVQTQASRPRRATRHVGTFLVYTLLLIFALLTLFPFLWMVLTSFKQASDVFRLPPSFFPSMVTTPNPFANYAEVLTRLSFARYTLNSLLVATLASSGQLVTCSLAGFAFARLTFPAKRVLFSVLLATMLVPIEVTIIPEFLLMVRLGWLDSYLPLIVPSLMVGAFGTFLLTEFFKTVPRELEEAATLDGAAPFGVYWFVFLPIARPALASLFVIAFITNWNELLRPVLYISTDTWRTLPLGLTVLQGQYESSWTLLMAGAVIAIAPLVLVYLAAQKYIIRGFMSSGIK